MHKEVFSARFREGADIGRVDILVAAAEKIGLDPSELVFVGNRILEDVRGPERMGMRAVLLSRGPTRSAQRHVTHAVTRLEEVGSLVDAWGRTDL